MRLFSLTILLVVLFQPSAHAVTEIDCTPADIGQAYTNAADGDIILIRPGIATFTYAMDWGLSKSVSFIGSGTNATFLISTNINYMINVTSSSTNSILFAYMTVINDGLNGNDAGALRFGKNVPASSPFAAFVRLTRMHFDVRSRAGLVLGYGGGYGLCDSSVFTVPSGVTGWNCFYAGGNEYLSWDDPNPIGTENLIVFEDVTSYNYSGNSGNGHWDGYNGASFELRHCDIYFNANNGAHGYDSQRTSTRYQGFYNNYFHGLTNGVIPMEIRGGVGIACSNIFEGTIAENGAMYLNYYRSCFEPQATLGYQGGTGFQGQLKTNIFSGTATGGSASTLVDSTRQDLQYYGPVWSSKNWLLVLTGGTGAGQSATVTSSALGGTFNVAAASFSPAPAAGTTYELRAQNGTIFDAGNVTEGRYTFDSVLSSTANHVLVGANNAESLSNLVMCINQDSSGSGTKFSANSLLLANRNLDFYVQSYGANYIYLTNRLDGAGALGHPGAMAPGVLTIAKHTNDPVTLYGCFSYANSLNGTNVGWVPRWLGQCVGIYNTNSVVPGQDYFNDALPGNSPLAYPHPRRATLKPDLRVITITSGSGATVTATQDIETGVASITSGTITNVVGRTISLSVDATSNGRSFSRWLRDGAVYSTDASISFTVDQSREFSAIYSPASDRGRTQFSGRNSLRGRFSLEN